MVNVKRGSKIDVEVDMEVVFKGFWFKDKKSYNIIVNWDICYEGNSGVEIKIRMGREVFGGRGCFS